MQKVRQSESTIRAIQQKIGKVPKNTTKLLYIRELGAMLRKSVRRLSINQNQLNE
jgi:hypothetical protein